MRTLVPCKECHEHPCTCVSQNCTWVDCPSQGIHPQLAKDGEVWACLCDEHHLKLEADLDSLDAKKILSSWVKAQGGAAKAAGRF